MTRAKHRNLPRSRQRFNARCSWTEQDDDVLTLEWTDVLPTTLARKLGRSVLAVARRAHVLGLPMGTPQGTVTIVEASRIYGFCPQTITSILDRYGVTVRLWRTSNKDSTRAKKGMTGRPRYRHFADAFDVECAVKTHLAWMTSTESTAEAAARTGISRRTLAGMVSRSGIATAENVWGDKRLTRLASWAWDYLISVYGRKFVALKRVA